MSTTETHIRVGYDKRCWARFAVIDLTPEELEILNYGEDDNTAILLREMDAADRLTFIDEDEDGSPEYFEDYANPSVVDVWAEEAHA